MNTTVIVAIISAISGLAIGYFTPILKHRIDKKKAKDESRKKLLVEVRDWLIVNKSLSARDFCNTIFYSQLRPYLSSKIIKELEIQTNSISIVVNHNRYGVDVEILDRLSELEKEWDLI